MNRSILAAAALSALAGCLPFEEGGVYACDTSDGTDCSDCDAATGWCRDITAIAEGASTLSSISGAGSNAVWAVGSNGVILRWNGSRWSREESGTSAFLTAVWAASPSEVFAVGGAWTWVHYDGSRWSEYRELKTWVWPPGSPTDSVTVGNFTAVGGFSDGGTGIAWALDAQGMVNFLCDSANGQYPCTGDWPNHAFQDQSYWALYGVVQDGMVPVPVTESNSVNLWGAWTDPLMNSYFIGRHGAILHDTATGTWDTLDKIEIPALGKPDLFAIWGDDLTGDFVAVGATGTVVRYARSTGVATWTVATVGGGSLVSADLFGVCGTANDDIFAVGTNGRVIHWNGSDWSNVPQPFQETLLSAYCTTGDLFAVSDEGAILHLKR